MEFLMTVSLVIKSLMMKLEIASIIDTQTSIMDHNVNASNDLYVIVTWIRKMMMVMMMIT